MRVGRVLEERLDAPAVDRWAREHDVACVYFLGRDEPGAAVEAEEAGFRLMDVRMELGRPAAGNESSSLRPATADDVEPLRELARANHRITRFYADPNFPDERCACSTGTKS